MINTTGIVHSSINIIDSNLTDLLVLQKDIKMTRKNTQRLINIKEATIGILLLSKEHNFTHQLEKRKIEMTLKILQNFSHKPH